MGDIREWPSLPASPVPGRGETRPSLPDTIPRDRPRVPDGAEDRALPRRYRRPAPAQSRAAASATAANSHPSCPAPATPEPQGFISLFDPVDDVAELGDGDGVGGGDDEDGLKITST